MWDLQETYLNFSFNRLRPVQLDEWISRLLSTKRDDYFLLFSHEVETLCKAAVRVLKKEHCLLKLEPANYHIVGDVHGQYHDLLDIIETYGLPPTTKYIFLGDYINRGPRSLEVMSLLLAMKLRWPEHVYLLRGSHETSSMSQVYGFKNECLSRCGDYIWQGFLEVFNVMPLLALIAPPTSTLLVHGGISPHFQLLHEIEKKISKPIDWTPTGNNNILTDLLWSDPSPKIKHWARSPRGGSCHWGLAAAKNFMEENGLHRIVRAHTGVANGYGTMGEKHEVVSLFSAPNYRGRKGRGCVMILETNGSYRMERMRKMPVKVATAGQKKARQEIRISLHK